MDMDSSRVMYIALKFNEMINRQDLNDLVDLMTDDHVFIDIPERSTEAKR